MGNVVDDEGSVTLASSHPIDKTSVAGLAQVCPTPTTALGSGCCMDKGLLHCEPGVRHRFLLSD
eukprot:7312113-Prorocentrum_lima.AAC.1